MLLDCRADNRTEREVYTYVQLVRTAEAVVAKVNAHLGEHKLTGSQFSAMKALALRGPLAQREIAASLLRTGGNITVVVNNLVKRGLVERSISASDGRLSIVSLTETGRELFDSIYPTHLERISAAMSVLRPNESEELYQLCLRLSGA
jgi:MarR family 2-MHQ and catechol resistance regulon transcriptional repressor